MTQGQLPVEFEDWPEERKANWLSNTQDRQTLRKVILAVISYSGPSRQGATRLTSEEMAALACYLDPDGRQIRRHIHG